MECLGPLNSLFKQLNFKMGQQWLSGSCRLTTNQKVGSSFLGSTCPSVEVSMSKTPNPSCSRQARWRLVWLILPLVYEWVNVRQNIKRVVAFGSVKVLYKCSPFTIFSIIIVLSLTEH